MSGFLIKSILIIGIFVATWIFPWWLVVVIAFLVGLAIPGFWELIIVGIIMDILFHDPNISWMLFGLHTMTLVGIVGITTGITSIFRKKTDILSL